MRRLARLHVRCGDQDKAATLYRWCALIRDEDPFRFGRQPDDLLAEVLETLTGEARIRAVEGVLQLSHLHPALYTFFHHELAAGWLELPSLLTNVVFVTLVLGAPLPSIGELIRISGPQLAFAQVHSLSVRI